MDLTVNLTTRGRYHTTLPLCLMSILNQSFLPCEIILVDDNEKKEFYNIPIFKEFLRLCKLKNIKFSYFYGVCKGQTFAQQIGYEHTNENNLIFKMDDDNILNINTLELLYETLTSSEKIGAVSGLILSEKDFDRQIEYNPTGGIYNKIEDIYSYFNIQMCGNQNNELKKVEHIYSNFMFKKDLTDGYALEFAPAGHREDTVFTHEIYRKGYDLMINPNVIIYHLDNNVGGNRIHDNKKDNKNDIKFIEKLKDWGIIPNKLQLKEDNEKVYTFHLGKEWLIYNK